MKRFLCLFLAAVLLTITACSKAEIPETTAVPETTAATQPLETTTATEPTEPVPDYVLTVQRNRPLTPDAENILSNWRGEGLPTVESILIDDVPILLIMGETDGPAPVTVLFHAGGGNKEGMLNKAMTYAKDVGGIYVCVDAGGCGESTRDFVADIQRICGLVADTDKIIAFVSTLPNADLSRIAVMGGSMGGASTLTYLARGSFKPFYACADVPCADFISAPADFDLYYVDRDKYEPLSDELRLSLAQEYSPLHYAENMMDTYLVVNVGMRDSAVSITSCQALEAKFQELGKDNCQFNYYLAGHGLTVDAFMKNDKLFLEALAQGEPVENAVPLVAIVTAEQ